VDSIHPFAVLLFLKVQPNEGRSPCGGDAPLLSLCADIFLKAQTTKRLTISGRPKRLPATPPVGCLGPRPFSQLGSSKVAPRLLPVIDKSRPQSTHRGAKMRLCRPRIHLPAASNGTGHHDRKQRNWVSRSRRECNQDHHRKDCEKRMSRPARIDPVVTREVAGNNHRVQNAQLPEA
jgi:hypothetical protein